MSATDDIYASKSGQTGCHTGRTRIEATWPGPPPGAPGTNPSKDGEASTRPRLLGGRHAGLLAARGYSRDGRKGKLQIEYGLLTDLEGRPVAVRVFPGNTGDPSAFTAIADVVRNKFGLTQMVMVGDRGMI